MAVPSDPAHMVNAQSLLARAIRRLQREDAVRGERLDDLRPGRQLARSVSGALGLRCQRIRCCNSAVAVRLRSGYPSDYRAELMDMSAPVDAEKNTGQKFGSSERFPARRLFLVSRAHVIRLNAAAGTVNSIDLDAAGQRLVMPVPPSSSVILACSGIETTRLALASFPT